MIPTLPDWVTGSNDNYHQISAISNIRKTRHFTRDLALVFVTASIVGFADRCFEFRGGALFFERGR